MGFGFDRRKGRPHGRCSPGPGFSSCAIRVPFPDNTGKLAGNEAVGQCLGRMRHATEMRDNHDVIVIPRVLNQWMLVQVIAPLADADVRAKTPTLPRCKTSSNASSSIRLPRLVFTRITPSFIFPNRSMIGNLIPGGAASGPRGGGLAEGPTCDVETYDDSMKF